MFRGFQIGFNKAATKSIDGLFRKNGLKTMHWASGRLAQQMESNRANGLKLLTGLEDVQFFSDMECLTRQVHIEAFKFYQILAQQYPKAVYILNTRDIDRWVRSRMAHRDGSYMRRYMQVHGLTQGETIAVWRKDHLAHHRAVRAFFKDNSQLRFIEFNIDKHGPERITNAIPELELDPAKYGHIGANKRLEVTGNQNHVMV